MKEIPAALSRAPIHRWASLRTELLWIYDGLLAPENRHVVTDHRHGYWVWLLRTGTVKVDMDRKSWTARTGQWMVSPHGPVVQDFSPDASILSVHFLCQWPTGENLFSGREGLIFETSRFPQLEKSASVLRKLVHRHFPGVRIDLSRHAVDYSVFLKFEQCFTQWLLDFSSAMVQLGRSLERAGESDERLLHAVQCLHETPLEDPFPEKELIRETGLGRAHLDRLYWKEFGVTTREYWERLREESATRSLEVTSLSIKEISYHLGFKQPSHFTRWFTRRVGATPIAYRDGAGAPANPASRK